MNHTDPSGFFVGGLVGALVGIGHATAGVAIGVGFGAGFGALAGIGANAALGSTGSLMPGGTSFPGTPGSGPRPVSMPVMGPKDTSQWLAQNAGDPSSGTTGQGNAGSTVPAQIDPETATDVVMAVAPLPTPQKAILLVRILRAAKVLKPISLPAWKKITVDIVHIAERHMEGGRLTAGRTIFPSVMSEKGVLSAIREAYRNAAKVGVQGADRVLLQGRGAGMTIEMWFNKATKTLETAYPVP